MKKYFQLMSVCAATAFMMLIGMTVTACGDDDNENVTSTDPDGDDETTPSGTADYAPNVSGVGITDPVVGVAFGYGGTTIYNYVNGVITNGVSIMRGGTDFTVSERPLTINFADSHNEDEEERFEMTFSNLVLNDDGFITIGDYTINDVYDNRPYTYSGVITIDYDSDGRMQSGTSVQDGSFYKYEEADSVLVNFVDSVWITFAWDDNGNLIGINKTCKTKENGQTWVDKYKYAYTYGEGSVPNNGVIPIEMQPTYDVLCYGGMVGKLTANIPTAYAYNDTICGAYTVDTDEKGRIRNIYTDGVLSETYYYADTYAGMNSVVKKAASPYTRQRRASLFDIRGRRQ